MPLKIILKHCMIEEHINYCARKTNFINGTLFEVCYDLIKYTQNHWVIPVPL